MKFFLSQTLLCAGVFGQSAGKNDSQQSEVVSSLDRFMGNCYLQLAMAHPTENLFFSPLSISTALYMVSLGAKSETHRQILEGLSLDPSEIAAGDITKGFQHLLQATNQHQTSIVLNMTNACFLDKDLILDPEFRNDLTSLQSEVISTDFKKPEEAKYQINTHVEEKTNGLIKNLLDGLDYDTKLIFTNTMYFKGTWKDIFNKKNTHEEDFHVNKTTAVKVPMMTRDGRYPMASLNGPDCTMVEVPYKGNVSAVFILPNEGKMEDVEKAFPGSMREWMKKLKSERIILSLPRFSASATIDLLDLLPKLGIKDVFSDNADLSGITKDHKLKVSKAIHKAVVNVDEEGTEAAAATAIRAVTMSLPPQIKMNRPFLMTILDKVNNVTLFTGRIINPQE